MVSLILGKKGSGKTKLLIEKVNEAIENSNGNVVCVEKQPKLTYDVNYRARLIDTDHYKVSGYDAFFGLDRKSTRLNSSHYQQSRMPSSA